MDKIKEYCDERQRILMWVVVAVYIVLFVFMRCVDDCLSSKILDSKILDSKILDNDMRLPLLILIDFVPSIIAGVIYRIGIKCIRGALWKKKFPQWDIGGQWEDTTEYHGFFDCTGHHNEIELSRPAVVNFEQKYDSIKILDSEGEGFRWHSMSVTLTTDGDSGGTLHILYEVNYDQQAQCVGYPQVRNGYEEMHIDLGGFNENKPQRPNKMSGKFTHCVDKDGTPSYYGEVCYIRKERENRHSAK